MTINEIIERCDASNLSIFMHRVPRDSWQRVDDDCWYVSIDGKGDGVKLEVKKNGPTLSAALNAAWAIFDQVSQKGIPLNQLAAPI